MVIMVINELAYLGTTKGSFQLSYIISDKPSVAIPAKKVESIIIERHITITSAAFELIEQYCIPIHWNRPLSNGMKLLPLGEVGTVAIRKSQYEHLEDAITIKVIRAIVRATITNRINLLKWLGKKHKLQVSAYMESMKPLYEQLKPEAEYYFNEERDRLRSIEAQAAKTYFAAWIECLPEEFGFERRARRPAKDLLNALLNYGYAILQGHVTSAVYGSGLDVFAGLYHVDRPGRPSLVLDMMEEFRQVVVDRCALQQIFTGMPEELTEENGGIVLADDYKKEYIGRIINRLEVLYNGKTIEQWIYIQSRTLALFLRGKRKSYRGFTMVM